MRRVTPFAIALAMVACEAKTPAETTEKGQIDAAGAPVAAQDAAPRDTVAEVEEDAFVTGMAQLRKIPSDARKIDDPEGKSTVKVSNWVATLFRGEEVTVTGSEGDWSKVRASDESEGWLKRDALLRKADVKVGTVFEPAKVFRRPDMLAFDAEKTLDAGQLLFVIKNKDQFAQVNYPRSAYRGAETWMLASKLSHDSKEVAAAKLIMKIRHLREKEDSSAGPLEELARSQYSDSKLIGLLEPQAGPEAPTEGKAGSAAPADEKKQPAKGEDKPEDS